MSESHDAGMLGAFLEQMREERSKPITSLNPDVDFHQLTETVELIGRHRPAFTFGQAIRQKAGLTQYQMTSKAVLVFLEKIPDAKRDAARGLIEDAVVVMMCSNQDHERYSTVFTVDPRFFEPYPEEELRGNSAS